MKRTKVSKLRYQSSENNWFMKTGNVHLHVHRHGKGNKILKVFKIIRMKSSMYIAIAFTAFVMIVPKHMTTFFSLQNVKLC